MRGDESSSSQLLLTFSFTCQINLVIYESDSVSAVDMNAGLGDVSGENEFKSLKELIHSNDVGSPQPFFGRLLDFRGKH